MRKSPTRNLILVRILAAVSAVVSTYLLVTSLRGGIVAGCGPDSGCEDVLASRWAYWLGMPVSGPALLLYATMFVATFWATPDTIAAGSSTRDDIAVNCSLGGSGGGPLVRNAANLRGATFLSLLSGCTRRGGGAAILILRSRPRPSRVAAIGAVLGVAALLAGHWINRPATHEVAVQAGAAPGPAAAKGTGQGRQLEIFGGLFAINIDEVPLIGRRDAPAVMVSLLDYTCPHCRQMHGLLLEAERAHRGKLAIATLPLPLDAACNKLIARTSPQHENACQYARLALAVWRADPSKMDRFNDWLFEPEVPPAMGSAFGFAQEIVGEEALGRAMNDPWVEKQLAQDIAIYETTYRRFGKGAMPQLIIGDNIVFGGLEHGMEDLETFLRDILK